MDTFDYIIVALGVALIVIGLVLFIYGKRESANANNVEGFGIKVNVSNPSIILIVFGIGLVLFPRVMPNQGATTGSQPTQTPVEPIGGTIAEPQQEQPIQQPPTTVQQSTPAVFFPQGHWMLHQYEENRIDLSDNVTGTITFNQRNANTAEWLIDLLAVDGWGNMMNYQYQGIITAQNGGYLIDTQMSNDPSFVRQPPTNLIMKMDAPNNLHMEYFFNGSAIIIHFEQ